MVRAFTAVVDRRDAVRVPVNGDVAVVELLEEPNTSFLARMADASLGGLSVQPIGDTDRARLATRDTPIRIVFLHGHWRINLCGKVRWRDDFQIGIHLDTASGATFTRVTYWDWVVTCASQAGMLERLSLR